MIGTYLILILTFSSNLACRKDIVKVVSYQEMEWEPMEPLKYDNDASQVHLIVEKYSFNSYTIILA
jgi:hypothetical protein